MKPLRDQLSTLFGQAFAALGANPSLGEVVLSQKRELAQFQCNGAMAAAKALQRNPREVAQAVIETIAGKELFADLSIAGPGFINILVSDAALAEVTQAMASDARLGIESASPAKKVVVDYGGPNVAKPMHVGHLRSTILGDCIKRLMRFLGHEVLGDIHLGDWGTQMGMLIVETRREQPGLPYFDADFVGPYPKESPVSLEDLQRMYPAASARAKTDEEARRAAQQATVELQQGRPGYRALWQHFVDISIAELKEDFGRLGVEFDLWYGESFYHDRIPALVEELKASGHAVMDDGALIIPVADEDEKKPMPPVIVLKSDGGSNYHTTDLATIQQRVRDMGTDWIFYAVDKRQSLHFEQLFRAARRSGLVGEGILLDHLAYGTMNGTDGRPFKTREGGVMRLKDLIEMMTAEANQRMLESDVAADYPDDERATIARLVGLASLKYADLQNVRSADYVFDMARFTRFEGKTGAYMLMAAVRIKSILRKAAERGFEPGGIIAPTIASERDLLLQATLLSDAIRAAASERMPHHLCAFAYDLSQAFSRFYNDCHILTEEDPARQASWLGLSQLVLRQLELVLGLLGIETPDRM